MSYVNPNIDHNLYNSMMPQLPVDLMARVGTYRQQMYDAGVAQFQQKVGSMLNMENNVSSELVKGIVNNYNKEANDVIKQYATLDFSRQDNVNLVDKVYEPLMNDKAFMMDYSATLSKQSQIQKALALRDSSKKEDRDQFNMTNFRRMLNDYEDLGTATTLEELTKATGKARGAVYTPYEDYKKDILTLVSDKSFFVTEDTSPIGGGYMVSYKGTPYKSMAVLLESMLTDKQLGQMKIEADVRFHDEWKLSGVSKTAYLGVVQDAAIKSTESKIAEHEEQITSLDIKLASFADDKKLSPEKLAEKQKTQAQIKRHQSSSKQYSDRLSNYTDDRVKFKNGEIGEDVVYNSLEHIASTAYMSKTINDMADGLSQFSSTVYSEDKTYFSKLSEERLRSALDLERTKFRYEQSRDLIGDFQWGAQYKLDAMKEGFMLDANGNLVNMASVDSGGDYVALPEGKATTNVLGDASNINTTLETLNKNNAEQIGSTTANVLVQYAKHYLSNPEIANDDDGSRKTLGAALSRISAVTPNAKLSNVKNNLNLYGFDEKTKKNVLNLINSLTSKSTGIDTDRSFTNDDIWSNVLKKINSFASGTGAEKTLHGFYMNGEKAKIHSGLALKLHKEMVTDTVNAFNNANSGVELVRINPKTGKVEGVDSRRVIKSGAKTDYNEVIVGLSPEQSIERFEKFLKTQEGIEGSFQSVLGKGVSNDAVATAIVSSTSNNQLYQNYNEPFFTKEQINNNEGTRWISTLSASTTAEINRLTKLALQQVASDQKIMGSNKNPQYSVTKFEDFGHFQNIKFNRAYLERIAGISDFDNGENKAYKGSSGFTKDQIVKMIDFIMQNNVVVNTGKEQQGFNSTKAYLSKGYTIPITSNSGNVKIDLALVNNNGTSSYEASYKMPEGYIRPDGVTNFSYDLSTGAFTPDKHVPMITIDPVAPNIDIDDYMNFANKTDNLNDYIKSASFNEILQRDIKLGKIKPATNEKNGVYLLPSSYITETFDNNYRN
jgi:hypothetical protein